MKITRFVLSAVLFVFGGVVTIFAQPALQRPSVAAQTWFKIGYNFDEATNPKEIASLRTMLPAAPPTELVQTMTDWEKGAVKKDEVRPHLVAYAKASGGYQALEVFRLGEWCSRLDNAVFEFMLGAVTGNDEMWVTAMNKIMVLAAQSQGFIDALSEDAPATVVEALRNIETAGKKANMVDIYFGRVTIKELFEAVLVLPDLIGVIKTAYGME